MIPPPSRRGTAGNRGVPAAWQAWHRRPQDLAAQQAWYRRQQGCSRRLVGAAPPPTGLIPPPSMRGTATNGVHTKWVSMISSD